MESKAKFIRGISLLQQKRLHFSRHKVALKSFWEIYSLKKDLKEIIEVVRKKLSHTNILIPPINSLPTSWKTSISLIGHI